MLLQLKKKEMKALVLYPGDEDNAQGHYEDVDLAELLANKEMGVRTSSKSFPNNHLISFECLCHRLVPGSLLYPIRYHPVVVSLADNS